MTHYCKICDYYTEIKSNYKKHLSSQKHLLKQTNLHLSTYGKTDTFDDTKKDEKSTESQPGNISRTAA